MSHKRKGQLTVSGEWARHLRPFLRRAFWKGERQAERAHLRDEAIPDLSAARPSRGSVEDVLSSFTQPPGAESVLEVWVPAELTLGGHPIENTVAMAVVLDAALELGLTPDGYEPSTGGRVYKYKLLREQGDA